MSAAFSRAVCILVKKRTLYLTEVETWPLKVEMFMVHAMLGRRPRAGLLAFTVHASFKGSAMGARSKLAFLP